MRVLMISANRAQLPMPVMPLGACLAAEAAAAAGHEVRFLDLMFVKDAAGPLRRQLAWKPDVVGISLRNLDNNDARRPVLYFRELRPLVETVRKMSAAPVVLGGAAAGVMPEALLRYSGADYVVSGNADESFPRLLAAIERRAKPYDVPGAGFLEGGRARLNGMARAGYEDCRVPDFRRWLDVRAYRSRMVAAPVQTKRGCPFNCVYCTYPLGEGREYRLADPRSVAREVTKLARLGYRDIEFVDNVFNAPYEHADAVCAALAAEKHGARLHTVELNPGFLDTALLARMRDAGFSSIGMTPESASDAVLRRLGKSYTVRDIEKAARAVNDAHLPCLWIFMLGGPGESRQSVEETFAFAREYVRQTDLAFFNIGTRIYPGTPLETMARAEGLLKCSSDGLLEPVTYFSPQIDRSWLEAALREFVSVNRQCIAPESSQYPFLPLLYRAAAAAGLPPPFWRYGGRIRALLGRIGVTL